MSAFLRKLFERYARRLIIGKGEGIRQIPNKDRVRLMADNIYKDFKKAGATDDMFRSEKDIERLHHQFTELESQVLAGNLKDIFGLRKTPLPKKSADVFDLLYLNY